MKQISLLFLEASVFFFSSVNIFTSDNEINEISYNTPNQIEEHIYTSKKTFNIPKINIDKDYRLNNGTTVNRPTQNYTCNKPKITDNKSQNIHNQFNTHGKIEERNNNNKINRRKNISNNTTADNIFNFKPINYNNNYNNNNNTKGILTTINKIDSNTEMVNYNNNINLNNLINDIPEEIEENSNNNYNYNQTQIPDYQTRTSNYNNNNYNDNIRKDISTSNQFSNEINYNNNIINYNTINNTGETQYEYTNQYKNQGYSNNNIWMIPEEVFPDMRQDNSKRRQLLNSEIQQQTSKLKEETINEIKLYNKESEEKTPETKENNLIKYNVVDPKKQIPGIRSSVTKCRNNRKSCCGIKNLKIEKNTIDMTKAKNNINNEIEKTIIEKFKNITFNIVLDNDKIKEIRDIVVGNIDKIIIDNKGKEEKKEKKVGKKKNKKESKKQKEKEDKEKIIAAKISIVQSCIDEIKSNHGSYFGGEEEADNVIGLFGKFKESLKYELDNLQINDDKDKKKFDNADNEVKKIFEKHFGKEIESIITNDDFIRKEYEKFNESEFNEDLGELDNLKKENYDKYKERLNGFFKCIKTKTLANINKGKTKEFATNMKNNLVGNIIEKVSEKVSIEKVKEKGIEIINKNTSKENDNKEKNKNKDNIELETKKN